jgi:CPA1 family monovalent cation:H+ antiporter
LHGTGYLVKSGRDKWLAFLYDKKTNLPISANTAENLMFPEASTPATILTLFIAFLSVSIIVAFIASRLHLPFTVAMVVTGLFWSALPLGEGQLSMLELEPDLILVAFLPALLFEASYHIDLELLKRSIRAIGTLAIAGTVISALIIGGTLSAVLDLQFATAMVFGVLISATDPVAVVALFKELGVVKRLGILVEGESLFNDGVAIVLFTILAQVAVGTEEFGLSGVFVTFLIAALGGAALGWLVGSGVAWLMARTEDPMINLALSTFVAYGLYLFAHEVLHELLSPVIAVVVAGIIIGNERTITERSPRTTVMIPIFWEYMAFLINSAIFFLIGLEIDLGTLVNRAGAVVLTILIVLAARAVVVFGLVPITNRFTERISFRWTTVLWWGGLRGAVSMALVLSLPITLENRSLLTTLAFGYVLFSLLLQGLSMPPLLRLLGFTRQSETQRHFEEVLARIAGVEGAIQAVKRMQEQHILSQPVSRSLTREFNARIQEHQQELNQMIEENPELAMTVVQVVGAEILNRQRQAIERLERRGIISSDVYEHVLNHIADQSQQEATTGWEVSLDLNESLSRALADTTYFE